ncbi:NifB/NifX family molybdenum-iron cluster-binding protein [Carboxylicivirga caseinilyticus]|uniref:NifB/NifX family molybdenum-iron cluster-binding protein n=1 Tax=Carboxylicivirga caseinilyticus TaxID=3417572 RepID=UPI003D3534E8|nr:dinitrogenase iron-molybdenum cofactor biosynthesis protein [Marinilabiliaceae bacterium A049]
MKIAITSTQNIPESTFDLRFGRASYFCIYNTENNSVEFIDNENINANSGAGIKAAEKVIELGVSRVISGDFGPKAKDLLDKFKIQMVMLDDDSQTISSIIKQLNK